ncbi:lysine-specific demethylase JMJ705-like [Curcuma longa]|uniref:lysine-specific demethylase JMJ705-like n=1 Tax=Curcuma longa TaxID=136217 RepID=UPI003D9F0C1A
MADGASPSSPGSAAPELPPLEVPPWLRSLPSAPEFHPKPHEFHDPIAYILKIEKEAAPFGICKIVPPFPSPPKKTALANLNRSFAARCPPSKKQPPTFTTRQQQIGFCPRRPRPVQKHVWQSGAYCTLQQFEAKARKFERSYLRRTVSRKAASAAALSPLEIETLFWRASADKPFTVEYANDMPGSGFVPLPASGRSSWPDRVPANVGESAWNMRGVSRAKSSLLRLMKEEIPGVTSPMVYVAMLFSWFAWHVEDHELHSLNYLHTGSGKTWYGVPRDARLAFEEVVRMHGYGGELNPLMTFAILGEKTTVMSPEVFVQMGIPCCRLVQNAGEFVVTFPGAYHMGFSHGFNCGEAANIATPEWLKFAKEAAVRRASMNYPPMVSHFQLLYALALSLRTRMPIGFGSEPRSSRLKHKMKGEGEEMIKKAFVQNVIQNNHLLSILLDTGTSCVVLPQSVPESPLCSYSLMRTQVKVKPRLPLGLCSQQGALEALELSPSNAVGLSGKTTVRDFNGLFPTDGNSVQIQSSKINSSGTWSKFPSSDPQHLPSDSQKVEGGKEGTRQGEGMLDQGLLSCVTCGILSFACVAIIQPTERAANYLMSVDCGFLHNPLVGSGKDSGIDRERSWKRSRNKSIDIVQVSDQAEVMSDVGCPGDTSALDLLASVYADLSDNDDESVSHENSTLFDKNAATKSLSLANQGSRGVVNEDLDLPGADYNEMFAQSSQSVDSSDNLDGHDIAVEKRHLKLELCSSNQKENRNFAGACTLEKNETIVDTSRSCNRNVTESTDVHSRELRECQSSQTAELCSSSLKKEKPTATVGNLSANCDISNNLAMPEKIAAICPEDRKVDTKIMNSTTSLIHGAERDSSRMHVFCLEHAKEVEEQLRHMGGGHMMLLCHPDYPKIESEAKLLERELRVGYTWKNINFRDADKEDLDRIKATLEDEEVIPTNSDWTVKLDINLYYTANLSKSPIYNKQMPYNPVIYKAFGCNSTGNSPVKSRASARRAGRQKKIVVAGRWCGKVWMTNQVHPYLAQKKETEEQGQIEWQNSFENDQDLLDQIDVDDSNGVPLKSNSAADCQAAKSSKKRKKPSQKEKYKKPRCTVANGNSKTDDEPGTSGSSLKKTLRSGQLGQDASISKRKSNLKDEAGGPSSRLRKRPSKPDELKLSTKMSKRKGKTNQAAYLSKEEHTCDIEGCNMSFSSKQDLTLHKRDICPVKGCGKKFFSHKYLVLHRKVHMNDRPLVCPWKGCQMTFKWPWARTEHIRVHTGDRPYVCREPGCGQTFRFVSDFSRHKRKTGHSIKKGRKAQAV